MLSEQRHRMILKLLEERRSVSVTELTKLLGISESTARRDIVILDREGKLRKVFGGAVLSDNVFSSAEATVSQRVEVHREEKKRIAKYAASLIQPKDFVYLDAGTTTGYMLDFLEGTEAFFVTNAVAHAQKLAAGGKNVILTGGTLKSSTEAVVGTTAVLSLKDYHFTKGFFGTNGVTKKSGCTTPDINEAMIKRTAMGQCRESYVLCDSSKFDHVSAVTFAPFSGVKFLTNQRISGYEDCDNVEVVYNA